MFESIEHTAEELARLSYVADEGLATSLYLALRMEKALFLEGEPGVGKTEVAKVLARAFDTELIRLQCYEGLDLEHAVYEWNYPRQLLELQAQRSGGQGAEGARDIFREEMLLRRPLLQAIDASRERAPVLLIDELDRADEEFESFLLELLSDFQVTIPELGTLAAAHRPMTVITSNRTREIHDALKRRCVYHWIDFPTPAKELEIVRHKVPGISEALSRQVVAFVQLLRQQDLYKLPGIAETLDWATALGHLAAERLDPGKVEATLGMLLKYQEDVDKLRGSLSERLVEEAVAS
jgi:MoxR-like ATPase